MKKTISLSLAIIFVLAFAACKTSENPTNSANPTASTQPTETASVQQSSEPTVEPTTQATAEPTANPLRPTYVYVVHSVDAQANTFVASKHEAIQHIAGEVDNEDGDEWLEIKEDPDEPKEYTLNDDAVIEFADVWNSQDAPSENPEVSKDFFFENATRQYYNLPMYFFMIIDGENVSKITLFSAYYFAG